MSLAPKKDKDYYLARLTSEFGGPDRLKSIRDCMAANISLAVQYESLESEMGCKRRLLLAIFDQLHESINHRFTELLPPDPGTFTSFQDDRGSDSEGSQRESTHGQARSSQLDANPSQGQGSVNTGQSV